MSAAFVSGAVSGDIPCHLASARGMTDVHRILEIERLGEFGCVGVHIVAAHGLGRSDHHNQR